MFLFLFWFNRSSDHSSWKNMASRAFHLQSLQPRIGNKKLLRTWRSSILWTGLSQFIQSTMCLLQWCNFRCKIFFFLHLFSSIQPNNFNFLFRIEMCNRIGENMAHGTLFLCSMRSSIWWRWFSWTGWQAILSERLFRYVCTEM